MAVEAQQRHLFGAVVSDPESGLTSNASGSKKRARDDAIGLPQQQQRLCLDQIECRQMQSATTSTSGRPPFFSLLHHQNAEIDALIRLQMEKLRSGLEEARKRQYRAILSAMEQQMNRRIEDKQLELENLKRRNAELEEKARQIAAEGQIWFHVARNSEALVSGLRSSLEQALLHSTTGNAGDAGKEGFGDNGDDALSCCYEGEGRPEAPVRRACRSCGEGEACVLVLPCRHLCLCEACEGKVDTCPVCRCPKNRSLRIFLS